MNDLNVAHVAQSVEHILGKDEVISSILIMGSSLMQRTKPNAGETNG
jgi:hypothetical protein